MKEKTYKTLVAQITALIEGETNQTSILSNVSAVLDDAFPDRFWWTGFYLVDDSKGAPELILGPFQGPVACMHIGYGRGVCGSAWKENRTLVVPDVEQFPGHIACSSESKSEIVVPMFREDGTCWGVLDIDSRDLNAFDETDAEYLGQIVKIISQTVAGSEINL